MKSFLVLCLFALCACGDQNTPVAGVYDIVSTAISLVPNPSNVPCGTLDTTPHNGVFEVVKESGEWVLYGCDSAGVRQVKLATWDGGAFKAHGCVAIWCEDITLDLSFETKKGKTTVDGEGTVVLTAPNYSSGTCTQTSTITGTKRITGTER